MDGEKDQGKERMDGLEEKKESGGRCLDQRTAYFWSGLGRPLFLMLFAVVSLWRTRSTHVNFCEFSSI